MVRIAQLWRRQAGRLLAALLLAVLTLGPGLDAVVCAGDNSPRAHAETVVPMKGQAPDQVQKDTTDCQAHTSLISAAADGTAGNADSNTPSMSADGRFVAFSSEATNLISSTLAGRQIFLRDTCFGATTSCTPQTTLISTDEGGALSGNDNLLPSLSSSGRFVAFLSVTNSKYASKSGSPNSGIRQVFVRDTCFGVAAPCTPKTTRLSVMPGDTTSLQGKPAGPAISSSAQAVGVSSASTPTVLTRTVPVDDRVFLALTNSAQK